MTGSLFAVGDAGTLAVSAPLVLLALLALPLFFAGSGRTRRDRLAAGFRALAATAVILLLAGLHLERPRPARGACVIAAVDVSASVQHAAQARAATFLADLAPHLGPDDLVGAVVFAARARVVARPTGALGSLFPAPTADVTGLESGDTDLAAALAVAAPLCPEGKQAALVLFTDGNETEGSLLAQATLTEPPLPVHAVVPAPRDLPAAVVRRVLAPTFTPAFAPLPLEVVVESRAAAPLAGVLTLVANGEPLVREPVRLEPGLSVVALPYRPVGPGQYHLAVALEVDPARTRPPGVATTAVTVTPPLRVLVVSERDTPVLATALAERGMQVEIVAPPGLAARASELAGYHLVVLENLARAGLANATLEALAAWVAAGGGLVVTGGEHFFGDPGFAGSALERVLPVGLRPQTPDPKEREPIALYLVIDRSNSMGYASGQPTLHNGEKIAYAKRAALAVLDQLGPRDLVAAIAFDSQPYSLGPLRPAGESRANLVARIRQIQYGGGTDFKEALEIARRDLLASGRAVRHIILLTDGDTNRGADDHAALIAALARAQITVTTIRIGADTINVELLEAISRATGGEFHHVADVQALPQLMIRDAQRRMSAEVERQAAAARVGEGGTILAGITEAELPPVAHWALTRARADSEVRLYIEAGDERDPLLATWQYELGRVAVLPVDFQAGAAAWAAWSGFGKLWTQLAAWAAPRALPTDRHLEARRERDGTRIALSTVADADGPFRLALATGEEIELRRVAPRRFAATVRGLPAGMQRALLHDPGATAPRAVALLVPRMATSDRESRATGPNLALLRAVARATGGRLEPAPPDVLRARAGMQRARAALDWLLVPLALAFLLADVAARRGLGR